MNVYPDSPFVGQVVSVGGTRKQWDGSKWINVTHGNHELRIQASERGDVGVTLAVAQALDLDVGDKVVLTDYAGATYEVVANSDTGGLYKTYKTGFKFKLSESIPSTRQAGLLLDGSLSDIALLDSLLNVFKEVRLSAGVYPPYNFSQSDLILHSTKGVVFTLPPNTVSSMDTVPVSAIEFSGNRITVEGDIATNGNSTTNDSSGYNLSNRRGELHVSGEDLKINGWVHTLDAHYVGVSFGSELDDAIRPHIDGILNYKSKSYITSFWSCLEWSVGVIKNKDLTQGFNNRVYTGNESSSTKVCGRGSIGAILGRGTYCVYEIHTVGLHVGYMDVAGWKSENTVDLSFDFARSIDTNFDAWGFGATYSQNLQGGNVVVNGYQGTQPRAVQLFGCSGSIKSITVDNNQAAVSCDIYEISDGFKIGNLDLNGRDGTATGLRMQSGFIRKGLVIENLNSRNHTGSDAEIAVYDPENIKILNVNEDINISASYDEIKRRNIYKEGTDLVQITSASGTVTLAADNDTLSWTQVGRDVTVKGRLAISSVSSASGALRITGLDNTPLDLPDSSNEIPVTLYIQDLTGNPLGVVQGLLAEGATEIIITRLNNGTTVDDVATYLQAGSRIILSCTYSV